MPKRYVRRLVDYPFVVVRIECRFCRHRRGYRLVRLAHRCGPDLSMESLLDLLACRYGRQPDRIHVRRPFCGIKFADLLVEPIFAPLSGEVVARAYFVECEG